MINSSRSAAEDCAGVSSNHVEICRFLPNPKGEITPQRPEELPWSTHRITPVALAVP